MNTCNIDDLLKVVSPSMVAAYERQTLKGLSLSGVNEEYKTVKKDPYARFERVAILAILVTLGILLWNFISFFTKSEYQSIISFAPTLVFCLVFFFWMDGPFKRSMLKDKEILSRCTPILEGFRKSVEAFNHPGVSTRGWYTEALVRDVLVALAVGILKAEKGFDTVRSQEYRATGIIICCGRFLEDFQSMFYETSNQAKKFGFNFKNEELFAEAKKHISSGLI